MRLFVSVIRGRFMSYISAKFHPPLLVCLIIATAAVLTACQPVSQTTQGRVVVVPVIVPNQATQEPAERRDTSQTTDTGTALQADELAAEPPADDNAQLLQQPTRHDEISVGVRPADDAIQPVAAATFNPAELVGKPKSFLDAQFGQADFSRTDGILHVLQYRQPDCVIDLFVSVADTTQATPSPAAEIIDWAMRERIINQPLDTGLCEQQFFKRKR